MHISQYKSIVNVSAECFDYVSGSSDGIWNVKDGQTILQHPFFRFQLQLIAMYTAAHFFHLFLKRFDFPRLTSDFLAGVLLGPTFMERFFPHASELLFPPVPNQVMASMIKIGYILFTFLAAVRMDISLVTKSGKRIIILGILISAFPYITVRYLTVKFDRDMTEPAKSSRLNNAVLYFSAFTTSEFIDVSALLLQLKITNSRLGHLALATTLVCDVARICYDSTVNSVMSKLIFTTSIRAVVLSFAYLSIFLASTVFVAQSLILWFIRSTPPGKPIKDLYSNFVIAAVLVSSCLGDSVGLNYLMGPLTLGLVVPAGSPLATNLTSKLDTVVSGLLIPLLYTFCASKFNLWVFLAHCNEALNFQMAIIGYAIKLVATASLIIFMMIDFRDAITLALILNFKGPREMGTFYSYTPIEQKDLDSVSGVFLICLLASIVAPVIKMLYDPSKHYIGYKKKCVQYATDDAPLNLLVCAHKQEDAMAATKLLEFSNPTKLSPLVIYGLCLEELLGSDTPYMINHQLGQRRSHSQASRSLPIIDVFNYFMVGNKKGAQVHVYTAVSPIKMMHEDICWLAFDKTCSLIILPFHEKWNSKGKLVSNNNELRKMNINVLERAPCSVGILIDRSRTRGLSSIFSSSAMVCRAGVLFIGGADDREALAYALRMAKSPKVQLTVVCCEIPEESYRDKWEETLDIESLTSMRHEMSINGNINYIEETVTNGSDTVAVVRTMEENYELIIVGRLHETKPEAMSGLSQWAELPELGEIGDQLASAEIEHEVAILVVQQQILKASHSSILN